MSPDCGYLKICIRQRKLTRSVITELRPNLQFGQIYNTVAFLLKQTKTKHCILMIFSVSEQCLLRGVADCNEIGRTMR